MKTAFLFPGQGAQAQGMGADLYLSYSRYREAFDRCEAGAGLDLKAACFKGEGMDESGTIQAAIYTHSVATLRLLEYEGVKADVLAGLSLGEYGALCAAGVIEDAQGASIVKRRGAIMDGAVPPGTGGMLSVAGLTLEQAGAVIAPYQNVFIANHLSETQMALGGLLPELEAAKPLLEAAGARLVTLLAMKGPSHCPLLGEAADRFGAELARESFAETADTRIQQRARRAVSGGRGYPRAAMRADEAARALARLRGEHAGFRRYPLCGNRTRRRAC